jgi:hypothetical protein
MWARVLGNSVSGAQLGIKSHSIDWAFVGRSRCAEGETEAMPECCPVNLGWFWLVWPQKIRPSLPIPVQHAIWY